MVDLEALLGVIEIRHRERRGLGRAATAMMLRIHAEERHLARIRLRAAGKLAESTTRYPPVAERDRADVAAQFGRLYAAHGVLEKLTAEATAELVALVKQLPAPIVAWVANTPGVGLPSLGVILGEAGDLARYPKWGHLWKRFGLHVLPDGRAPKREAGKLLGYSPARRSEMDQIGQAIIRTGGTGRYRALYDARKVREIAKAEAAGLQVVPSAELPRVNGRVPKDTPGLISQDQINRRAIRYVEKRLLRDLWSLWRRTIQPAAGQLPTRAVDAMPAGDSAADSRMPARAAAALPREQYNTIRTEAAPRQPDRVDVSMPQVDQQTDDRLPVRARPSLPAVTPDAVATVRPPSQANAVLPRRRGRPPKAAGALPSGAGSTMPAADSEPNVVAGVQVPARAKKALSRRRGRPPKAAATLPSGASPWVPAVEPELDAAAGPALPERAGPPMSRRRGRPPKQADGNVSTRTGGVLPAATPDDAADDQMSARAVIALSRRRGRPSKPKQAATNLSVRTALRMPVVVESETVAAHPVPVRAVASLPGRRVRSVGGNGARRPRPEVDI